jgi:hypothetical protein
MNQHMNANHSNSAPDGLSRAQQTDGTLASLFIPALRDPEQNRLCLEILLRLPPQARLAALDAFIRSVLKTEASGVGVNDSAGEETDVRQTPPRHSPETKCRIYDALITQLESGPFNNQRLDALYQDLLRESIDLTRQQLAAYRAHVKMAVNYAREQASSYEVLDDDQQEELTALCCQAASALLRIDPQEQDTRHALVTPVANLLKCSTSAALTLVEKLLKTRPFRHRTM